MKLELVRQSTRSQNAIIGILKVDGSFECYTVENAELAIPAGTYEVELYNSPMHGPDTPQLKDVPGRANIQIHAANFPHQLLGCIAPGTSHGEAYVENSKKACAALLPKIRSAIRGGEPVNIAILV